MPKRTTIMIRPPSAMDLIQISELWLAMQCEWHHGAPWRGRVPEPTDPPQHADETPPEPGSSLDDVSDDDSLRAQQIKYDEQLREWYRDEKTFMLVGARDVGEENAGELVAYIVACMEDVQGVPGHPPEHPGPRDIQRFGRIVDLYVRPSLRGNDLAKRMVEATAGWMQAQQCAFLEADVLTSNRSGMGFLASTGFQLHRSIMRRPLR